MPGWLTAKKPGIEPDETPRLNNRNREAIHFPVFKIPLQNIFQMNPLTTRKLLELNQVFYHQFGSQFSLTRQRLQPGVSQLVPILLQAGSILDIGCGNGELSRNLSARHFQGQYFGLDFSAPLLQAAKGAEMDPSITFIQSDLASPTWDSLFSPAQFSHITAFAVLHHLPGADLRGRILKKIHSLLGSSGWFLFSNWQFLNSEKLSKHVQPWEKAGLTASDVDEGDYLMDWRSGGSGLRYVHHFSERELEDLALRNGFKVLDSYLSDGKSGRLGLYQIWERNEY